MLLIRKKSRSEEDNWSEDEAEIPAGGTDSLPVGPIPWVIVNASLLRSRFVDVTQRSPQRNSLWGEKKKGTKRLHFWSKIHSGIVYSI